MVPADMDILKARGLNMLRLGTMWPGVEPVRGQCRHLPKAPGEVRKLVGKLLHNQVSKIHAPIPCEMVSAFLTRDNSCWYISVDATVDLDKLHMYHREASFCKLRFVGNAATE